MECELKVSGKFAGPYIVRIRKESWKRHTSTRFFCDRVSVFVNGIKSQKFSQFFILNRSVCKRLMHSHKVWSKVFSKMIHGHNDLKNCWVNVVMWWLNRCKCKVYYWCCLQNVNIYCICVKSKRIIHELVWVACGYVCIQISFSLHNFN